jgi:MFS transporter, FSR family, fosmidomycin resistance protein
MAGFAAGPVLVLYLTSHAGTTATAWLMAPGLVLAGAVLLLLPDWEPHRTRHQLLLVARRAVTGPLGRLTVASTLVALAFITATSAIPLWLVSQRHLPPDAPLLGWTLAVFSLAAALGAIAGGAIAPRLGPARTAAVTILLATVPLTAILTVPAGAPTLLAAAVAGALLYMNQPVLITAAQQAVPEAPTAAAGVVIGIGGAAAGVLYIAVGIAQDQVGLTSAILVTFALLVPAAALANRALRTIG